MTETKESGSFLSRFKGKLSIRTKPVIILTAGLTFQATQWAVATPSYGTAPSSWASISCTPPVSSSSPSVGLSIGESRTPSTPLGRLSMWSVSSPHYPSGNYSCSSSDSTSVILRSADCSDRRQSHLRERSSGHQSSHQVMCIIVLITFKPGKSSYRQNKNRQASQEKRSNAFLAV